MSPIKTEPEHLDHDVGAFSPVPGRRELQRHGARAGVLYDIGFPAGYLLLSTASLLMPPA